jgi:hypothetical protein
MALLIAGQAKIRQPLQLFLYFVNAMAINAKLFTRRQTAL